MVQHYSEEVDHIITIPAAADAFAGTKQSTAVDVADYHKVAYLVEKSSGSTGTFTLQLKAGPNSDGSGATAIPFNYRKDNGDLISASQSGFTVAAGAPQTYVLEPNVAAMANLGRYLHLASTEVVDSPVLGSATFIGYAKRFG